MGDRQLLEIQWSRDSYRQTAGAILFEEDDDALMHGNLINIEDERFLKANKSYRFITHTGSGEIKYI